VATCDGLYPLRLSQACDICDRSLEVIVKEGLSEHAVFRPNAAEF
jgi:hypothetical protein